MGQLLKSLLLCLICISLTSCLSTVRIRRSPLASTPEEKLTVAKKTSVDGIPFYVQTAKCKQQTVWVQPVTTLTLKKTIKYTYANDADTKKAAETVANPTVETKSKILSQTQMASAIVKQLRAELSKPTRASQQDITIIEAQWTQIAGWEDYSPLSEDEKAIATNKNALLVSNTASAEMLVDYSRTYYYNSPRPWVGSSKVDAKLNTDGTLSEGSAENETQTLSTFVSALPISSVLTTVSDLGLGVSAAGVVPGQNVPVPTAVSIEYQLASEQVTYKHTHTKYGDFAVPCEVASGGVTSDYALTIDLPGDSPDKSDDGKSIQVKGTIALPKDSGDDKKKGTTP